MAAEKRICFVLGGEKFGGTERVACILANYFVKLGWKADMFALLKGDCRFPLEKGVTLKRLGSDNLSRIRSLPIWVKTIWKYLSREKPDVIVSFSARINCIVLFTAVLRLHKGTRLVISERNDPKHDTRTVPVQILTNMLYRFADKIVFQTEYARRCFKKAIYDKGVVIGNPVLEGLPRASYSSQKIVNVAKLEKQKNHFLLIEAFRKIAPKYPETTLHIFGDGSLREELEKHIIDIGLKDRIILEGWKEDIHERIKDARLFVLSSDYEGLSNALIEAAVIGLPCISTDCAGANEIIKDHISGIVTPVGDPRALSEAMDELLGDKEKSKLYAKQCMEDCKKFTSETVLRQWEDAIGDIKHAEVYGH